MSHATLVALAVFDSLCGLATLLVIAKCAGSVGWQSWMWIGATGALAGSALGWTAVML